MSDKDNDTLGNDFGDGDDAGFDDFGQQNTLGDMWRNNPVVKLGVILGGFAVIVGAIILFGGKEERLPASSVRSGAEIAGTPADEGITEDYRQRVLQADVERVEEALRQGKSALPTPIEPSRTSLLPPEEEPPAEDPLERWRRLQETRQQQVAVPDSNRRANQAPDTRGQAVTALAEMMASQMQSVLEAQEPQSPEIILVTGTDWLSGLIEEDEEGGDLLGDGSGDPEDVTEILIPAGEILYGQTLIEANTDAPGPVLAQIVSGPYAGSRMIGEFEATDNFLVLTFSTIVIDGVGRQTAAIAIDPDTSLPGVITEIDRRYFKRVILPMAAAFVEGLTGAIAQSGSTTITISDAGTTQSQTNEDLDSEQEVASGLEEAGQALREILEEEADSTVPMLRVKAGTPLGILFVEPVTEKAR